MQELVKINKSNIGNNEVNSVNARELYMFLEVGRDFSTWIKQRIDKYNFLENEDWCRSPFPGNASTLGKEAIDYIITLDMAKELAMVENNDKGREVRKYFIEVEKAYKKVVIPLLQEEVEAQKALAVEQIVMSATKLFKLDDVASVLYAQDRFYASKLPVPKNIPILKAVKKIFYRTDIYQLFPKSEKKQIKIILDKMQENKEYAQMNLFGKNGHTGSHYVFYENIIDLIKKELNYLN